MSDSLRLPWTVVYQAPLSMDFFPGKNIGVGSHFLLQGIFLTQGSNRISCCCSVAHRVQPTVTPWTAACQASLSFTISQSFLKLTSIELVIPFSHLIFCCPFSCTQFSPASGSFPMRQLFASGGQSTGTSASVSNEFSRLISFRNNGFDLLAVQRILKSLCQNHSSKASVLQYSAFFMVQLSHPYMTTGKIIALSMWTFVGKVMSLLFNMLSRFVIAFLPKSKCLLISCLQSPSEVILEPRKIKSITVSIFSPSICHEVIGTGCHDLQFLNAEF